MSWLIRMSGMAAALGLAALALAPLVISPLEPGTSAGHPPTVRSPAFAPLPPVNDKAGVHLLETSPFAPDRSAFDRTTAAAPPAPPVEVKLTGIFRVGKELRASLNVDGHSVVVRTGDDTAAGKVERISLDGVTLSGPPPRMLEIFK